MLLHQTMENDSGRAYSYQDVVNTRGNTDYVKDGKIYKNNPSQSVLVRNSDDLELLEDYNVGTIAYTAGFNYIWIKRADGQWVEV